MTVSTFTQDISDLRTDRKARAVASLRALARAVGGGGTMPPIGEIENTLDRAGWTSQQFEEELVTARRRIELRRLLAAQPGIIRDKQTAFSGAAAAYKKALAEAESLGRLANETETEFHRAQHRLGHLEMELDRTANPELTAAARTARENLDAAMVKSRRELAGLQDFCAKDGICIVGAGGIVGSPSRPDQVAKAKVVIAQLEKSIADDEARLPLLLAAQAAAEKLADES